MKIKIFILIALSIVFIGCNKKYYEPEKITTSLSYDASVSKIIATSNNIIQLEDGSIITDKGLLPFKLKEDEQILNLNENDVAVFSKDNRLIFYSFEGEKLYQKNVNEFLASASKSGNLLVTISAQNLVKIEDSDNGDILFEKKYETQKAISNKMASTIFYNTVIFIPTLDGRLIVIDRDSGNLVKDFAISNKTYFDNIIFLKVLRDSVGGDKLVVATPSKIVSMLGQGIERDYDIKEVLERDNRLYILTTNGEIILTDKDLNVINSKKYKYAIFSNSFVDDSYIYVAERKGHLIVNSLDLKNDIVHTIPDEIENYLFINNKNIFYEDSYINLKTIIKP